MDGFGNSRQHLSMKVQLRHPAARLPAYGSEHAACFDLVAVDDGVAHPTDPAAKIYETGLSFEIPEGWVMMIYSRSGHGFKSAFRLSNCSGVIDADFRGEVKVSIRGDGDEQVLFKAGDRIAQAMLSPAPRVSFEPASKLSVTARGEGGFGSTGTATTI